MSLTAPTNVFPDSHSGLGSGVIDAALGLTEENNQSVTWQINGQSLMWHYQIDFYQNDTQSTFLYSTGKLPAETPNNGVYGRGPDGRLWRFRAADITPETLSDAGIVNGYANGYKMLITQWWQDSNGTQQYIQQTNPSFFYTRTTPTVSLSVPATLTSNTNTFNGTYSQAQGDDIAWIQWQLAIKDDEDNPFIDTGHITGTQKLEFSYNDFRYGKSYSINLTIQTELGMIASTGWQTFDVNRTPINISTNVLSVCQIAGTGGVRLQWKPRQSQYINYTRFFRAKVVNGVENPVWERVASLPYNEEEDRLSLIDYGAKSNTTYRYYLWELNSSQIGTFTPVASDLITPLYPDWYLYECEADSAIRNIYHVLNEYRFSVNVENGAFSNNNSPTLMQNFTRYPNYQATASNYLTGSLTGFIGYVDMSTNTYTNDTPALADALDALSASKNPKFLKSRKGELWRVEVGGAITRSLGDGYYQQPYKMTIPWVQVGSAEGLSLVSTFEDESFPGDQVFYTSITVDPVTGALLWTTPNGYTGGSILSLNGFNLQQTDDGSFVPAKMDVVDDHLFAEIND